MLEKWDFYFLESGDTNKNMDDDSGIPVEASCGCMNFNSVLVKWMSFVVGVAFMGGAMIWHDMHVEGKKKRWSIYIFVVYVVLYAFRINYISIVFSLNTLLHKS